MKENKPAGHHYTAREIIEIIDAAQARGVTFIKVEGFEAVWEIEDREPAPEALPPRTSSHAVRQGVNRVPARPAGHGRCDVCNDLMVKGQWGPYCVACFKAKKEREENR